MARLPLNAVLVVALVTGSSLRLSAQVSVPFPPRPADPACGQRLNAALSLTPGLTRDSVEAVLAPLYACVPEIGPGIAAAAVALRATSDTATAMIIFQAAAAYRDTAIFRVSRSLAVDASASNVMRVSAMRALLSYVSPAHVVGIQELARYSVGARSCGGFETAADRPTSVEQLSPVSPSAAQEARDAARTVLANGATPAAVGSAAYCVMEAWRAVAKLPSNAYWGFDPLQVSAENVCGTRYRLRNMHPVPIALQYGVPTAPAKGRITLAAPPNGASFSEFTLDAPGSGTLTLYLDGLPLKTVPNAAGACP
jgi:hypothetical protein